MSKIYSWNKELWRYEDDIGTTEWNDVESGNDEVSIPSMCCWFCAYPFPDDGLELTRSYYIRWWLYEEYHCPKCGYGIIEGMKPSTSGWADLLTPKDIEISNRDGGLYVKPYHLKAQDYYIKQYWSEEN